MKLYALIAIPVLAFANLAHAMTPDDKADKLQQAVRLSDLDLNEDADIAILKSRIRSAAINVCKNTNAVLDRACFRDAEMVAIQKVAFVVERYRKFNMDTKRQIFAHNSEQSPKCK